MPDDLKGRVGLLHFWASWCPYCRKEFMAIEALFQQYKSKGFLPYSINVGEINQEGLLKLVFTLMTP